MKQTDLWSRWHWESTYPAPAKLNLFLHVVGRRADGYHLLQTLFRFVDFGDDLRFSSRPDAEIVLANPLPGVPPEHDLAVRAARLLQNETGCRQGATIFIDKRLPMGGGLGGGSSDAATVLIALNHLWRLGLSRRRLQEIGLQLGADVPVFVFGQNAFAEGVGEDLQAVELSPAAYLVLQPSVAVPTVAIFGLPELKRDTAPIKLAEWMPGFGRNDLQPAAAALFPEVAEHLRWLSGFAEARMTGSGACVFAEFSEMNAAESVRQQLPASMHGWCVAGLAEHPLRQLAA